MKVPSNLKYTKGDLYNPDNMKLALTKPVVVVNAFLWNNTTQGYEFWYEYRRGLAKDGGVEARAVLTFMLQEIGMLPSLSYEELLKELL